MKKIAIVTPFLAQGGLEKVAVTMAENLKNEYKIDLIVFDTFRVDYKYDGNIIDLNIPFYQISFVDRIKKLFVINKKVKRLKKENKYDLIIIHGELANLATLFSGHGKHLVVIHENRINISKGLYDKAFKIFAKFLYKNEKIKKLITVSEGIRKDFIKFYKISPNKITTIYNSFDIEKLKQLANEPLDKKFLKLFEKYNVLITVGRLSEQKGHKYLIEIFSKIKKDKLKLVILGDGELRKYLYNYAKEFNLDVFSVFERNNYHENYDIYFLGFHSNPFKFIKNSKIFIMSSLWEGFGNTIVEAMACEVPIISTDCKSGPREIIAPSCNKEKIYKPFYGEYGILMPEFNQKINYRDWEEVINLLLSSNEIYEKYKVYSKNRAYDFDNSKIIKKWKDVINEYI
ncbi:glycosyltransferase [Caminibacter mediatlanticus]|uniref:Capsular polysaccharide biosynthsis protein M n=1 Tax=Caminibacter mediatlanticus TB-2 TaxID=391592 RepID=A0AAI9AG38_9BACT|nr:glycosyltransferase [Caminibacter mediatlanticus]EDM22993.1 capsular polysaccharide biosynthsis protein M [Caminibacter mediatlanticus TB-2]